MALWDDALRRAGMTGASPGGSGPGTSTSQQLLARGSGPGRPGEDSGSSSLPLALSRATRNPLQRWARLWVWLVGSDGAAVLSTAGW